MKKNLLLFILVALSATTLYAQKTITVQSNGQAAFYTDWATAWTNTQAGDTIYLPGGTFNTGNIIIDRKVTIIGVGHDGTQTHDGLSSHLNGNIYMIEGSDYTHLHGFQFTSIYFYHSNNTPQQVSNITVSRCHIKNYTYLGYAKPSPVTNIIFEENIFGGIIQGRNAQHISFVKNIIDNRIHELNGNTVFSNNIFSYYYSSANSYAPLQHIYNVLFQNNIFRTTAYPLNPDNCENNVLLNNIIAANITINTEMDLNTWSGNFFNQPLTGVFVNFPSGGFSPDYDYNLLTTSVGKQAGTDGFDIGIYGTAVPYKEGAVPFTPRITLEKVSGQTDANGNIDIQINVSAQQR